MVVLSRPLFQSPSLIRYIFNNIDVYVLFLNFDEKMNNGDNMILIIISKYFSIEQYENNITQRVSEFYKGQPTLTASHNHFNHGVTTFINLISYTFTYRLVIIIICCYCCCWFNYNETQLLRRRVSIWQINFDEHVRENLSG